MFYVPLQRNPRSIIITVYWLNADPFPNAHFEVTWDNSSIANIDYGPFSSQLIFSNVLKCFSSVLKKKPYEKPYFYMGFRIVIGYKYLHR